MQTSLQVPDPEIHNICGSTNPKQFALSNFFSDKETFFGKAGAVRAEDDSSFLPHLVMNKAGNCFLTKSHGNMDKDCGTS